MQRFFVKVAWRYLTRHPWQSILMILGVSLGVAVAVAVDLANTSANRAFILSTEAVAGKATHYISAGPSGLDENLYVALKASGLEIPMTPVLSDYISSPQLGNTPFQLLGVDVFTDAPFHNFLTNPASTDSLPLSDLVLFLTKPGAILLSTNVAARYNLELGQEIDIEYAGQIQPASLVGFVQTGDDFSQRALQNLILADIASAQEITSRFGKLDRIDLVLEEKNVDQLINEIKVLLPQGVYIQPVEARTGTIHQMTAAFRVNLTALSLLAMVVGVFLIYNTMTFAVVQRRILFGTLRILGVTHREIFWLVVSEAAIVGILGASLGLVLGVIMGQGAVKIVSRTINDLFFVLDVQGVQIPFTSLAKGFALGFLTTVFAAAPPAWEAASTPPRAVLSRAGLESKARKAVFIAALAGILINVIGGGILFASKKNLWLSFTGTSAIVIGLAALAPLATIILSKILAPVMRLFWGTLGSMAAREVIKSLSRTSLAVAALMVAISVTIGVSLMVNSFRHTVRLWLDQILQGDVYISAPSLTATQTLAPLDQDLIEDLKKTPGVDSVFTLRSVNVLSSKGIIQVAASSNPEVGLERLYQSISIPKNQLKEEMKKGAVVISEVLAYRLGLPPKGAQISLFTDQGVKSFPVVGVYYDYASTQGVLLMSLDIYRQYWNDTEVTAAALKLSPGLDSDEFVQKLQNQLALTQRLNIRPNKVLKAEVQTVFNRTFSITGALQLLAIVVAFIGVLSALLSLELEKQRELGILCSLGLTGRQLWILVTLETGILGTAAGFLAMPTGLVLAEILIYIINKRSFGWTLQMNLSFDPFIQAFLLALSAALLASLYPAWRISRMTVSDAMRFE